MSDQVPLRVDTGAPDHGRMRDFEADFTPSEISIQGLGSFNLARPPRRILEPCAGSGSIARAARLQWPGSVIHAVEPREEEAANLGRWAQEVLSDTAQEFARLHGNERYDLIVTNPPFSLFCELVELLLSLLEPEGLLVFLGLSAVMQRGKDKVEFIQRFEPVHEYRIAGAIKFRNGINPKTGRAYAADMRSYSWWGFDNFSDWNGKERPSWPCTQLPMLPSADRRWTVRPGYEEAA